MKQYGRICLILLALGLLTYIMLPFIIPMLLGGIFASGLNPIVEFLGRKGIQRKRASFIVMLTFGVLIFLPFAAFLARGAQLLYNYLNHPGHISFPQRLQLLCFKFLDQASVEYGVNASRLKEIIAVKVKAFEMFLYQNLETTLEQLPNMAFLTIIGIVTTFFLLRDAERLEPKLYSLSPSWDKGKELIGVVDQCAREIFLTNIITGFIQAIIVSVGASALGNENFFVLFVITFILSFVPVVGAAPVAVVLALFSFMEDNVFAGSALMFIALIAGVSDNIIRPYLISSGSIKIHPFINFMSILGGVIMFGFAGLFIGPFIVGVCFGALPLVFSDLTENKESL